MADDRLYVGLTDRRTPLTAILSLDGVPIDLAGLTPSFAATNADTGASVVSETSSNVSAQPAISVSASVSRNKLIAYGHRIPSGSLIKVAGTTVPSGLSASTVYRVHAASEDAIELRDLDGNRPTIATAGDTVTVSVLGMVQYAWQSADVASARTLDCVFRVAGGSGTKDTFPVEKRLLVVIQ